MESQLVSIAQLVELQESRPPIDRVLLVPGLVLTAVVAAESVFSFGAVDGLVTSAPSAFASDGLARIRENNTLQYFLNVP